MEQIINIQNVKKTYPNGCKALKGVSFDVKEGEFLVIIGLSGSGKSTLLRCINRIHDYNEGDITYLGESTHDLVGPELRNLRSQIGMIFQHFNLIPRRSVLTNVLAGSLAKTGIVKSIFGLFSDEDKKAALANIEIVGLTGKENVRVDDLSGGQKQRVAIARALMQKPKVLLADEPVASLDPSTSHSVMKYLEKINKELGVTVICNLHFLSLVRQYATRVVALKDGELVFEGSPLDISEDWFKRIYGEDAVEVTVN